MASYCNQCGTSLAEAAQFCHQCGTRALPSVSGGSAAGVGSTGGATAGNAAPPPRRFDEPEVEVWISRPSARAWAHYWFISIIFAVVMVFVAISQPGIRVAAIAVAGLPFLFTVCLAGINKISIRYRLTNQRIFVEKGILSRSLLETELVRIDDVAVIQNLMGRIFNYGTVRLAAADADSESVVLVDIDNPVSVKEIVRAQVRGQQARVLRTQNV